MTEYRTPSREELTEDMRVTWLYRHGGSQGFEQPVPARIVALTPERVWIDVVAKDGRALRRSVNIESLRVPGGRSYYA